MNLFWKYSLSKLTPFETESVNKPMSIEEAVEVIRSRKSKNWVFSQENEILPKL